MTEGLYAFGIKPKKVKEELSMSTKKVVCFILIFSLALGLLLTGCSGSTQNQDTTKQGEQTSQQTKEESKSEPMKSSELSSPVEFSYLRPMFGPTTFQKGGAYEKLLFEKGNVKIETQIVGFLEYDQRLPVMIAGKNMPDVVWHNGPPDAITFGLIEQGAFLPLNEYLDKYPAVKAAIPDFLWEKTKAPDGKNYFFPQPNYSYVPFPFAYRKDIFDEMGISEPTTLDEFVSALKKIKAKYPDKTMLTVDWYDLWAFQNLGPAFGFGFDNWVPDPSDPNPDNPAKIVPSFATQNYKEMLAWFQMLRKEGLIDPDFGIVSGPGGGDKFRAGNAIVAGGGIGFFDPKLCQQDLEKIIPDAKVALMKPLQGPHGKMACTQLNGFNKGFSISSMASDNADEIFKFLNWYYTDGYDLGYWGVEGEMYTVDANGKKSRIPNDKRKPEYKDESVQPLQFPGKYDDAGKVDWDQTERDYAAVNMTYMIPMLKTMYMEQTENPLLNYDRLTYSKARAESWTKLNEQYILPMRNKLLIDPNAPLTMFDEAIDNWLKNGGQLIIDEVNQNQKDKSKPIKPTP